jgi:hypothetical protein
MVHDRILMLIVSSGKITQKAAHYVSFRQSFIEGSENSLVTFYTLIHRSVIGFLRHHEMTETQGNPLAELARGLLGFR